MENTQQTNQYLEKKQRKKRKEKKKDTFHWFVLYNVAPSLNIAVPDSNSFP